MRAFVALAAALAVTTIWFKSAEAAEARIEGFAFACETPDGQTLKPKLGDIAGVVFADLPVQRAQCLETIGFKIGLCRQNTRFGSSARNEIDAACLPVFEQQARACIGHFTFEEDKCSAAGPGAAPTETTAVHHELPEQQVQESAGVQHDGAAQAGTAEAPYTVDPLDQTMDVAERANVRTGPATDYAVVSTLDAGVRVHVTGSVRGRDWLRVELEEGASGFIFAPLLQEPETFGPEWLVADNQACRVHKTGTRPGETVTWSGACLDGKASGEGSAVWLHGGGTETYEGAMEAGRRHGSGTYVAATGDRYEGGWRDGTMHGRGAHAWADGRRYRGGWRNGSPEGHGRYIWPGRGYYDGAWRAGQAHGLGTFVKSNGSAVDGHWKDGCFEDGKRYDERVGAAASGSCGAR